MKSRRLAFLLFFALVCSAVACKTSPPSPHSTRLTHLYKKENLQGQTSIEKSMPAEWRFSKIAAESGPTGGWTAYSDVSDLKIENGILKGRSTSDSPIINLQRTSFDENDLFHSLEIRLRVSAGNHLSFSFSGENDPSLRTILDYKKFMPWDSKSIAAGEHFQNIILTSPITTLSKKTRNIFIQPTNASDATFEIEFIKLVLRKDYLSSIPTGLSWQGLSGIFQESVVMHTPEKLNIPITLSEHPELELKSRNCRKLSGYFYGQFRKKRNKIRNTII